ncbi:uncharacterized protein LOC115439724 [Manduca sexta]|uniref:Uncharacterized protein n=1 Tax=Manduca sexta TaxID=7130 RepID=A0A921YSF5_MANSE|nr:uncharacterized protein LOC115439724 [Manduca sexta]KAG6444355.1 hypothetical protein O3G_MSEX003301 [Manduca sexta]
MMDLKEIIKWFIPCFHILLRLIRHSRLIFISILLLNIAATHSALVKSEQNETKNIDLSVIYKVKNQSDYVTDVFQKESTNERSLGRTFGRPFKKLAAALIPLAFQIGAASTWAVIAALVGVKTLVITLIILKLLLVAGAAKIGALFGQKGHYSGGWEAPHPHQKEIHLHIHNGHHETHDEPSLSSWSRDGALDGVDSNINVMLEPYAAGPQTISTPYGNYVKVEPSTGQNSPTTAFY